MDELKRLWDEVWYGVFGFHLGSDYRNYTGLEFNRGKKLEGDQGY